MSARFSSEFPYPSQRMPVLARNVVATSQPLAAQAGLQALQRGGNAVDAAIAAAVTLTVVEPTSNGIGSDLFAILWADGQLHGLNSSGRSPAKLDAGAFAGRSTMPTPGWEAVTVPGAVAGWAALSHRFGRLPFRELFESAISYAADGYLLSPITAAAWQRAAAGPLKDQPDFVREFTSEGRAPQAGELIRLPGHARSLQLIADSGGREFYEGSLAAKIAAHARSGGSWLSEADLAAHQPDWVDTIHVGFAGSELHELPPNGQGIAALTALGLLQHTDIAEHEPDSVQALHLQLEAMKLAFADTHRYVADPAHMKVASSALLDPDYLEERARLIDPGRAQDFSHGRPPGSGTVYLSAADQDGMMVSFIQSNYMGFGSGIVVPETGIALQNRGADYRLDETHPNALKPGKRSYNTIIPGFLTKDGQAVGPFGVMGGFMQPQGHLQLAINTIDYQLNPQAALDAPRWQWIEGNKVLVEPDFPNHLAQALTRKGHDIQATVDSGSFGRGQIIWRNPET